MATGTVTLNRDGVTLRRVEGRISVPIFESRCLTETLEESAGIIYRRTQVTVTLSPCTGWLRAGRKKNQDEAIDLEDTPVHNGQTRKYTSCLVSPLSS